jgi:hypothetical protein
MSDSVVISAEVLFDLAEMLHDIECEEDHENHECEWDFENLAIYPWNGGMHTKFLTKAAILARQAEMKEQDINLMTAAWRKVNKARDELIDMLGTFQDKAKDLMKVKK